MFQGESGKTAAKDLAKAEGFVIDNSTFTGVDLGKAKDRAKRGLAGMSTAKDTGAFVGKITISDDGKDALLGFGKHRGKKLSTVFWSEGDYVDWIYRRVGVEHPVRDVIEYLRETAAEDRYVDAEEPDPTPGAVTRMLSDAELYA